MLARNFATTTVSTIGGMALSFVASVVLARILGAELRGVYALAILIPSTIYIFSTFGLTTAHIVFSGKYPEKRGAIAFQSFAHAGVMGALALVFYAYLLTAQPAWFQRFQVVGRFNLILASFLVFLNLAVINLRSGVLGANRILVINIGTMAMPLSKILLVGILVWWLGFGVTGGILAQLGCFVFMVIYMTSATVVKVPVRTWKPDFGFFKKSISFGVKIYLDHIAWYVAHTIDRYMIAYLMPNSDRALGHYAMAAQFSQMLWILPQSLQTVFLPHLSVTQVDKPTLTVKTARVLFLALLPIFLVLTAASPLIRVILGHDYAESVAPFVLFLPGMFLFGSTRSFDSFLTHSEKPMYAAVNSWIGALTNIGLNFYFIPRMGITGAALASSLSVTLMALITVGCFRYETKLSLRQFVLRRGDFSTILSVLKRFAEKIKVSKKLNGN